MVAVSGKSGVKPLGYIVWFSVPDKPVRLTHLKKCWALVGGLDPKVLPPDPRPLYLFKRAMRAQEGKIRNDDGTVTETDVKPISEDHDICDYQISRVTRDTAKRQVDYPKAMRVTFDKHNVNDPLTFSPFKETPLSDILPMQESIEQYYEQNGKMIDGRKVRTMVREFIRDDDNRADQKDGTTGLSGENLRGKGGGVYFVLEKYKDKLDGLAEALHELHPDGSAYLYMVPLADGASERELVRRHHVNNTVKEMQEAMADVGALLREDRKQAVRSDHAAFHWQRLQALRRRAAEYNALLEEEQEDVTQMSAMLEKQLRKLPGAVAA
jgi:hypothetical protein